MPDKSEPRIVRMPSYEDAKARFEEYALALGKVIYAWNYLMETLGRLFVVVVGDADRQILLQIWHVPDSDRVRIEMLRAAAAASAATRWTPNLPSARDDVLWLTAEGEALIHARNDAAHGLVTLFVDADRSVISGHPESKSRRSTNLRKKGDLMVEFDRLERWAENLTRFTKHAESALHPSGTYPWPDRPHRPNPRKKTDPASPPPLSA